jgi:hypothetical protein
LHDRSRARDILGLATKSNQPLMTGTANLKAKTLLPPGKENVAIRQIARH